MKRKFNEERYAFPKCNNFSELFESYTMYKELSDCQEARKAVTSQLCSNSVMMDHLTQGYIHFTLKPTQMLVDWINENHYASCGTLYFQFIQRDDGSTLICTKYDHIIGGRWLALLEADDMPNELNPYAVKMDDEDYNMHYLSKMVPNGNRLELPKDDFFPSYDKLKVMMQRADGKYKKGGFVFNGDAEEIQKRLLDGEIINDKKKFQYFPTLKPVVKMMEEAADLQPHHKILEPSAGQGHIISALECDELEELTLVEMMPANIEVLKEKGYDPVEGDFLKQEPSVLGTYDRILANPPFTNNQDVDHIRHMYSFLKEGGRLVSIASRSWMIGSSKKQVEFREWLNSLGSEVVDIEAGAFKHSGTSIATCMIIINKK